MLAVDVCGDRIRDLPLQEVEVVVCFEVGGRSWFVFFGIAPPVERFVEREDDPDDRRRGWERWELPAEA